MNTWVKKGLGSVISIIATAVVTWLIAKGWITAEQGPQIIAVLASSGLIAAQRMWNKKGEQKLLDTALAANKAISEDTAKATVKAGMAPSAGPTNEVPTLTPVEAP